MTNLAEGFMLISEQEKSGKVGDVKNFGRKAVFDKAAAGWKKV